MRLMPGYCTIINIIKELYCFYQDIISREYLPVVTMTPEATHVVSCTTVFHQKQRFQIFQVCWWQIWYNSFLLISLAGGVGFKKGLLSDEKMRHGKLYVKVRIYKNSVYPTLLIIKSRYFIIRSRILSLRSDYE